MEFRQLGGSGFKVPVLSLGTGTFGSKNERLSAFGTTQVKEATRLVDISLEAGLNMFDSADVYSEGSSEEILGKAIKGRRDQVIISTKATFRSGPGHNDVGSSRHHLIRACESSLRRLGTDYIDLYQMHGFDALSPLGWGRLTGRIRRNQPLPEISRLHSQTIVEMGPPLTDEHVCNVVDAIDEVAKETGKTVPQIAINWLLQRPTVATVIIGARNEEQLRQNLGAVDWSLTAEQVARLDAASAKTPPYPYWHQRSFADRNPSPIKS